MQQLVTLVVMLLIVLIPVSIIAHMTKRLLNQKSEWYDFAVTVLRLGAKGLSKFFEALSKLGK